MPAFPGAIGCICGRHGITTGFKGVKFLDEPIVWLYLRTSCDERGKGARDE
jgi:hypothetical protein